MFGNVVEGIELLKVLESVGSQSGKTSVSFFIVNIYCVDTCFCLIGLFCDSMFLGRG